jgi:protocatechuate 3,4-dioxygenase beta subunit
MQHMWPENQKDPARRPVDVFLSQVPAMMRSRVLLLAILLFATTAASLLEAQPQAPRPAVRPNNMPGGPRTNQQQRPQQQPLAPEDYGKIEGSVLNAQTGEPIRKAEVILTRNDGNNGGPDGPDSQAITTRDDGAFAFDTVAPGRYSIRVTRTGFIREGTGRTSVTGTQLSNLQLAKAQTLRGITVKMVPQGVITGRVLDEDGEPVARANVSVQKYSYPNGRRSLSNAGGANTNDLGEYRIWGLSPATYFVHATASPQGPGLGGPRNRVKTVEAFAPTYFPGVESSDRATPIEITAGAQAQNIDIRLRRSRMFTISGIIVDPAGQPVSRANVHLSTLGPQGEIGPTGGGRGGNSMARDGSFTMTNVMPGSYLLQAQFQGRDGGGRESPNSGMMGSLKLDVGAENISGLRVIVQPSGSITGSIKFDGSDAPPEKPYLRVMLEPTTMGWMGGMSGSATKEDGKFILGNVNADRYRVRVSGIPAGFYLKNLQLGNQDIRATGLDFTGGTGAISGELTITLAANPGSIEGVVKNSSKDETMANVTVVLVPKTEYLGLTDQFKTTISGPQGDFKFTSLPPGEYDVFAFEEIENGAWYDPAIRMQYRDQAKSAKVEKGAIANVELKAAR